MTISHNVQVFEADLPQPEKERVPSSLLVHTLYIFQDAVIVFTPLLHVNPLGPDYPRASLSVFVFLFFYNILGRVHQQRSSVNSHVGDWGGREGLGSKYISGLTQQMRRWTYIQLMKETNWGQTFLRLWRKGWNQSTYSPQWQNVCLLTFKLRLIVRNSTNIRHPPTPKS